MATSSTPPAVVTIRPASGRGVQPRGTDLARMAAGAVSAVVAIRALGQRGQPSAVNRVRTVSAPAARVGQRAIEHPPALIPYELGWIVLELVLVDVRLGAHHPPDAGRKLAGEIQRKTRFGQNRLEVVGHESGAISVYLTAQGGVIGAVRVVGDGIGFVDDLMPAENRAQKHL